MVFTGFATLWPSKTLGIAAMMIRLKYSEVFRLAKRAQALNMLDGRTRWFDEMNIIVFAMIPNSIDNFRLFLRSVMV